jgi:hypothetical protein
MPVDRSLERRDPDWRLYVSDFSGDQWMPDGWVSARLHVQPTARPKVEQQGSPQGPLVWICFGPHFQCFLPRAVAVKLRDLLDSVLDDRFVDAFSVGASVSASSPPASGCHSIRAYRVIRMRKVNDEVQTLHGRRPKATR